MAAIGLFVMRMLIARRLVRLRWMTGAWAVAVGLALVLNLIYVDVATAKFALRSAFDLGNLIPLMSDSHFGKGYLTLELCLLLFAYAGAVAIWLDRPERPSTLDRRRCWHSPERCSRRARPSSPPRSPATPARPRRAESPSRSTGSTSPPARSGSAA